MAGHQPQVVLFYAAGKPASLPMRITKSPSEIWISIQHFLEGFTEIECLVFHQLSNPLAYLFIRSRPGSRRHAKLLPMSSLISPKQICVSEDFLHRLRVADAASRHDCPGGPVDFPIHSEDRVKVGRLMMTRGLISFFTSLVPHLVLKVPAEMLMWQMPKLFITVKHTVATTFQFFPLQGFALHFGSLSGIDSLSTRYGPERLI